MTGNELVEIEIEILTDGDVLREERLARSLYAELSVIKGLDVRFPPEDRAVPAGAKGAGVLADASLWIFLSTATGATARVLIAAIQAWSVREKQQVVRVKAGNRTLELPAAVTESHERVIQALLDSGRQ